MSDVQQTEVASQTSSTPEVASSAPHADTGAAQSAAPSQPQSFAEKIAQKAEALEKQPSQPAEKTAPQKVVAPAANAWAPNYKVKSYDKEFEIDEMFRPLIKDPETEKKVRSIFEKAYGLDEMKPKYQKTREELESLKGTTVKEYETIKNSLNKVSEMYNKGDLENFFKTIGVDDSVLFNYVQKRLEYNDLTPEKRAEYDRSVAARNEQYALQSQYQTMEQQFQSMQTQIRGQEMRMVLSQPSVSETAKKYDEAVGTPGSFVQEVVNQGLFVWKTQGKDISAEEAVNLVLSRVKPLLGNVGQQESAPAPQVVAPKAAVIPNIGGTSTSPVRKQVRSLDDIRNLSKNFK